MYEPFATAFETHARDGAYNAHYDRPALLELLGDVRGRDLLDAGCGPGLYAEQLLARGARVTAVDVSPTMVRLARERLGDQTEVRVHDLERPLDWLPDERFDLVLLALVLHHLDDRRGALAELHRVLRPGGRLVLSNSHPTTDWLLKGGGYFDRVAIEETWQRDWQVRWWRQPLQAWCDEFADAGFAIERLVEPLPAATMAERHADVKHQLEQAPGFIAFRLLKLP